MIYDSLNYGSDKNIILTYNPNSGKFEGIISSFRCYYNMDNSKYNIKYIETQSEYSNYIQISREDLQDEYGLDLSAIDITVNRWVPVINSIKVDKNEIDENEAVKMSIDISKPQNASYIKVYYETPEEYWLDADYLYYNQETKLFEGELTKINSKYKGKYTFSSLSIYHAINNNYTDIYRDNLDELHAINPEKLDISIKNTVPVINAEDLILNTGIDFDPLDYVSAYDKEDEEVAYNIEVIENTVDTSKVGIYKVVYKVTDSQGASVTKEIKVTVRSNEKPVIQAQDKVIKVGDNFDPLEGVSASDKEDGELKEIKVVESTVNPLKAGIYKIVYSVTDNDKNTVIKERKVTVNNIFVDFTVNSINNKSTEITGKGVSGATVKAYIGTKQIGNTVTVNSSGKYIITIPAQNSNADITVKMSKSGYETAQKNIKVNAIVPSSKRMLTKDIYKYDAGSGKYLTHINGKGYSQFIYLNTSGKYAFTPSSWMVAAGLNVTMPTSSNGYTMMIDNNYIQMYNEANALLNNIKLGKLAKADIKEELNKIEKIKIQDIKVQQDNIISSKAAPKKTLTKDIYKYDAGQGRYLTYINGKGYSQYSYLNTSGKYAFTPSSWMVAAGLTVTMPNSSNGYTMKIDNPYIMKYNKVVEEIKLYM